MTVEKEQISEAITVAEWTGTPATPAMRGMARVLSKKDVKESLVMAITRDLEWSEAHNFRVDVSGESPEFVEWLKGQDEFKVTGA